MTHQKVSKSKLLWTLRFLFLNTQYAIFIEKTVEIAKKYKNKIVKLIMVFSNCESKMGDFEPDVDIDEKQAGFKLDKDRF